MSAIYSSFNILFHVMEQMYFIDDFPEFFLLIGSCSEPLGMLYTLPKLLIRPCWWFIFFKIKIFSKNQQISTDIDTYRIFKIKPFAQNRGSADTVSNTGAMLCLCSRKCSWNLSYRMKSVKHNTTDSNSERITIDGTIIILSFCF